MTRQHAQAPADDSPPAASVTAGNGAHSREQLIAPLRQVFEDQGYAGATLSQLAAAVGLGKSSLYHHFPGGKREMAEALLSDAVTALQTTAFARLDDNGSPGARLAGFLDGFSRYVDGGKRHCLLAVLAQGEAPEELGRQIAGHMEDWTARLAATLEASGLKPKRARRLAVEMLDELYGALVVSRMRQSADHFAVAIDHVARRLRKEAT